MLNNTVNGRDAFLAELRAMPGRQEIAPNPAARSGPSGSSMNTRRLSLVCCVVAGRLAGLAMLGWTTGLRILARFGPRYIPMAPRAALSCLGELEPGRAG